MEYTIKELSCIANVSTRTLRYYDQIDLLKPNYINKSNYRIYTSLEVDMLQQILFYKKLGMSLKNISFIVNSDNFDKLESLDHHYLELIEKQKETETLLNNIKRTISNIKGEIIMEDKEKFKGFKQKTINENTMKYGKELNEKYGEKYIDESNLKFMKLSKYQLDKQNKLSQTINELLIKAVNSKDVSNEISKELCRSHQLWIMGYWPTYNEEAHMALVEMYLIDERFKQYYDNIILGGTLFLRDAMKIYLNIKK